MWSSFGSLAQFHALFQPLPLPRCVLLLHAICAMGGCWVLEQSRSSMFGWMPRFRAFSRMQEKVRWFVGITNEQGSGANFCTFICNKCFMLLWEGPKEQKYKRWSLQGVDSMLVDGPLHEQVSQTAHCMVKFSYGWKTGSRNPMHPGKGQLQPMNLEVGRGLLGRNSYVAPSLCLSSIICTHYVWNCSSHVSIHSITTVNMMTASNAINGSAKDLPSSIWISTRPSTWCFLQKQGDTRALW